MTTKELPHTKLELTAEELKDAVKTALATGQIADVNDLVGPAKYELQRDARQGIEAKVAAISQNGLKRVPCRIVATGVVVELERHDASQKIHAGVAALIE